MDLTFITEYISPITLIICLVIGFILKNCVSNTAIDNFIPLIVAIVGIIICIWDTCEFTPAVIAAGLISGLASTGLYEAFKQILHINNNINNEE